VIVHELFISGGDADILVFNFNALDHVFQVEGRPLPQVMVSTQVLDWPGRKVLAVILKV
jgi:hypothetical protein